MNEESLFATALDLPTLQRPAFLDRACADPFQRQRLERLLAADDRADGILDRTVDAALSSAYWPPTPLADRQDFAGRFHLLAKIGEGGMGEVWSADQLEPVRRRVALKVIRPGVASAHLLARFEQERQALALMNHPFVATVLDAGVDGGRPFFVMELIDGPALTTYCDAAKLTVRERLQLFLSVCSAVQHAHQKGVVHRDLKPSNLLVETHDGRPVPKVIDFGLAKFARPPLTGPNVSTEVGTVVGTLEYMSPEQADLNNPDIDTRGDIYALGVVLYELLTGHVPHSREELQTNHFTEMLRVIREDEPLKPSTKLSNLSSRHAPREEPGLGTRSVTASLAAVAANRGTEPAKLTKLVRGELDWIVMKCLDKDRERRYETAGGLAADLRRYLADEPVLAGPPDVRYRFRKLARRHRRALTTTLAFVLLLVAAVVTLTLALVAVNRERQEKVAALEAEGKRRKQTREALDAMSLRILKDWLARQPVLLPEHREFLELALRYYEEFAADTGQQEESRAGIAGACGRVGLIRQYLGQWNDAQAAWERGRELYEGLVADFPHVPAYRDALGDIHRSLGNLYRRTGRTPQEAEASLQQGLTSHRHLTAEFPDRPAYQLSLAKGLIDLGILLNNPDRSEEAEQTYGQALDILKRLVAEFPTVPVYHDLLAQTYLNLGILLNVNPGRVREAVLQNPGRLPEAAKAFAQAVAIYEQLAAKCPREPRYRAELANSLDNLGDTLRDPGQYAEAEELYRLALTNRRQLVAEFPAVPDYRRGLASTLNNLGILLRRTNHPDDAVKVYRESLDIHKKLAADAPESPDHQNEVAGSMVNLARMFLGRMELEEVRRLLEEALPYHQAARMFLRRKELDEARRLLEEALPYHQAALKANSRDRAYRNFYRLNRWRMTETLLELKDHAAAAATARQFLEAAVEPPRDAYTAACLLAGCVRVAAQEEGLPEGKRRELTTTYGDGALAALRLAIEKGAKEVAQMKEDARLAPLQPREDFQKLLQNPDAAPKRP